jgi:hypothetical protein
MTKVGRCDDGERALEILLGNDMMRSIARSGRYRVRANHRPEDDPPDVPAGKNLQFIDIVDYASDRMVSAWVDLDDEDVAILRCAPADAILGPAEENDAIAVAVADRRVSAGLSLGDCPQSVVRVEARPHRSAAIAFGMPRSAPSLVAVVDLARMAVTRIIPAEPR